MAKDLRPLSRGFVRPAEELLTKRLDAPKILDDFLDSLFADSRRPAIRAAQIGNNFRSRDTNFARLADEDDAAPTVAAPHLISEAGVFRLSNQLGYDLVSKVKKTQDAVTRLDGVEHRKNSLSGTDAPGVKSTSLLLPRQKLRVFLRGKARKDFGLWNPVQNCPPKIRPRPPLACAKYEHIIHLSSQM